MRGQVLRWRESEGIIGGIMFAMLLGLPVALVGMAYGVYGAARGHKVRTLRTLLHAVALFPCRVLATLCPLTPLALRLLDARRRLCGISPTSDRWKFPCLPPPVMQRRARMVSPFRCLGSARAAQPLI